MICKDCSKRTVCRFVDKAREIERELPEREEGVPIFLTIHCEEKLAETPFMCRG